MAYKIVVTVDAKNDLEQFINYLIFDRKLKYHRINFLNHRYFMLYRIVDDIVFVDNIFHELQDYENKIY